MDSRLRGNDATYVLKASVNALPRYQTRPILRAAYSEKKPQAAPPAFVRTHQKSRPPIHYLYEKACAAT